MITEKCTLPIGVEYNGLLHRDVEIRSQKVGDSIEAMENDRALKNESYMGLCILARQIIRLGDIPRQAVTADLLMELYEVDMVELNDALRRLQTRQSTFRDKSPASAQTDAGAFEDGLRSGTDQGDDAGRSTKLPQGV